MIEILGWCTVVYIVLRLLGNILKAKDKDRSWYEEPIFKEEE